MLMDAFTVLVFFCFVVVVDYRVNFDNDCTESSHIFAGKSAILELLLLLLLLMMMRMMRMRMMHLFLFWL